jgi:hypothetical protein
MYWQSFSLHATKSLPRPAMELRRLNVMATVSETTLQVKDFDGMRLTGTPLRPTSAASRRERCGAVRARAMKHGRVATAYQYLQRRRSQYS